MGLLDKIKADAAKSGQNKSKFFYVRDGEKPVRVRFLQDLNDGMEILFHDSFSLSVNVPCQEQFGKSCPYCENEDLRTRTMYLWSVYNYEAKEVQLFMYAVNNCSPIGQLAANYENNGTLTDRDYAIQVRGKQQNKTFAVMAQDKNKFRNERAKPYSKQQVYKMLQAAYPVETVDDIEDEVTDNEYEDMSARELFKECVERGIDVEPKKAQKYYVNLLLEADKANDDWADETKDNDDWDLLEDTPDKEDEQKRQDKGGWDEPDEYTDYEDVSPLDLFKECKDRRLDVKPRQKQQYYIDILKADDEGNGDEW